MAEKKNKNKPRFEVKKRKVKKEHPNFFQNIPDTSHPLAEILNFPSEEELDTQANETANPAKNKLDTQHIPKPTPSNTTSANPANPQPDTQLKKTANPVIKKLDTKTPSNKKTALWKNTNTPSDKKTGHPKNKNWKDWEKKRSTVRLNLQLDKDIDQKVREYCVKADPRIQLKDFYGEAALHFLEFLDTQDETKLGVYAPYDDRLPMMPIVSNVNLINLYIAYNKIFNEKARWKPKDDAVGHKYFDTDIRILELGIINTQFNAGFKKIHSFKYFVPQIEEILEQDLKDEMLKFLVEHERGKWQKAVFERGLDANLPYSIWKKGKSV